MVLTAWTPTVAELHAWGRHHDGWVGLLTWGETLHDADGLPHPAIGAGWLPAEEMRCSDYASRQQQHRIPRLILPAGEAAWPRLWLPAGHVLTWHGRLAAPLPRPGPTGSAYG